MKTGVHNRIRSFLTLRVPIGLRFKIIAGLTILSIALILLINVVVLRITERNLTMQKVREGELIFSSFNSQVPLITKDGMTADTLNATPVPLMVRNLARRIGFMDYILLDNRMEVVAASQNRLLGKLYTDKETRKVVRTGRVQHRFEVDPEHELISSLHFTGPIISGGRQIGVLSFSLSLLDIWNTIVLTRQLIFYYILLDALMVVILGALVLSRVLVKPIKELVAAVNKVGQGNFDVRIAGRNREDEIGMLAGAFSDMVKNLKESNLEQERQFRHLGRINEDLEKAQQEILSKDRLAYVGRVAAGVAHEVGNPLSAIFGYLEILRDEIPEDSSQKQDYVQRIQKEAERIDDIIRSLLDFAKPSDEDPASLDVNEVVQDSVSIVMKQRVMDNVEIQVAEGKDLPQVKADAKLLLQVLVNLLVNAKDAMEPSGEIMIETETTCFNRLQETMPRMTDLAPDDPQSLHDVLQQSVRFSGKIPFPEEQAVVKISVTDNGKGIEEESLRFIFDPFYTTKAPKKGTGLGLAICQRVIEGDGGVIRVESKPGKGTILTIYLPALDAGDYVEL